MICPKCGHQMKVTHTYRVPNGSTQRLECSACPTVLTMESVIVAVNPEYGEGAAARARRLRALAARTQVVQRGAGSV